MASVSSCSICHPLTKKSLYPHKIPQTHLKFPVVHPLHSLTSLRIQSTGPSAASMSEQKADDDEPMTVENLNRFVQLNVGNWSGSFYQFDANGKLLQRVSTKLAAGSYGEEELISLIQTLYIKQPQSSTSISGYDEEPGWAEYKIKESNMFTVDKYQQLGFFPNERAFALRYQTAGMLETVLRQGVLGEDDTGEESPKNLKLPSRRPSIVCENCLYSLEKDTRARAFHVLDPKGVLDMLLIFLEDRGSQIHVPPSLEDSKDDVDRPLPYLGQWKGRSVTKRSGIYGATIAEHDTVASLEIDGERQLIQDITSTTKQGDVTTNVQWTGKMSDNLVTFDKGYQLTLLPGGMYMGCPCDISKSVTESKAFHLEFCWLESPGKRQRLVRTYDIEGLAVSSTYFLETKV